MEKSARKRQKIQKSLKAARKELVKLLMANTAENPFQDAADKLFSFDRLPRG
jgi:hypothetical protein